MTKLFTYTRTLDADVVDAFCKLQDEFSDQFVFYEKQPMVSGRAPVHLMGLGRCIAVGALADVERVTQGPESLPAYSFCFKRFDADNPKPADELFQAFPRLGLMFPEIVLVEKEGQAYLQVNSLGPVSMRRVGRFVARLSHVPARTRANVPFDLEADSREDWRRAVGEGLHDIQSGRLSKVVLARRCRVRTHRPFTSVQALVNLIDGPAVGTVLLYRYDDVFFVGCTPELLVEKRGDRVRSMCLAGTCGVGADEAESDRLADGLMHDAKNRHEHQIVVDFMRSVMGRACFDVVIPDAPRIKRLSNVQHLCTPVSARVLSGHSLAQLVEELHPTPALSGQPVGEAMMEIRSIEGFNRGFFGGPAGYVDTDGDGEFAVAIRSGVFDADGGWAYAGCGIVDGSVADDEYDEIGMKLKAVLGAFGEGDVR